MELEIMYKKPIFVFLFVCVGVMSAAGQKLSEVLHQADEMSPYVAMYYLRDMQQLFTEEPKIYAKLGDIAYPLIETQDPITDYQERKNLLYSARLYYGNCLHFAKDKSAYPLLPERIRQIKQQEQETDSIYCRFNRLVDDYNRCVSLFTQIMDNHKREKTAHLLFSEVDSLLLDSLRALSATLPQRIADYQAVQTRREVRFRWLPIDLYRLDGLTYSNFLEADISLWDYYGWTQQFATTQRAIYDQLYWDMQTDSISDRLLNRLQQVDYGSAVHDWFIVRQQTQQIGRAWEDLAGRDSISTNEMLMHLLLQSARQQAMLVQAEQALQRHRQKMDEETFLRYVPYFRSQQIGSVEQVKRLAQADYNQAALLQQQFGARIVRLCEAYMQGKTEEQRAEEGFLSLTGDEVVAMPVSAKEMAVLTMQDGTGVVRIESIGDN
ncbi:MAG: hypothetical protein ACI30J_01890 [Paludibacteraceae bacterium]